LCTICCEERTRAQEAKGSPLLKPLLGNDWLRHSRLEKVSAGAVVICKVSRLAVALLSLLVPRVVWKWSINLFTIPNPVYSHTYDVTVYFIQPHGFEFRRSSIQISARTQSNLTQVLFVLSNTSRQFPE
jgi:hypothetical protein